ncbi:MAG: preprotein translocase subunit YajC [Gemmatimonadaceae bacterium]
MTLPLPVFPALMTPSAGGQSSLAPFMLQLGLIVAIFYFLLIRPQQKQRKQHERALLNLKKGDQIVTSGGHVGEVLHIKESVQGDGTTKPTMEDHVTMKSGDSRHVVERGRIAKINTSQGGSES